MDLDCYVLESNPGNLMEKFNSEQNKLSQLNNPNDDQINRVKEYNIWEEPTKGNASVQAKEMISVTDSSLPCSEDYFSDSRPQQVENTSAENQNSQKGRASLVRLQAAVQTPSTSITPSLTTDGIDSRDPRVSSADSSSVRNQSELPATAESYAWSSDGTGQNLSDAHYSSTSEVVPEPSVPISAPLDDDSEAGVPDSREMQRFLTSDGQYVYGYKDPGGEFHFFYPTLNDRETHNEKERKRRSRVSDACSNLRRIVPGLTEKTDKATVFEQAARYLQFLRNKYGTQFDQLYFEKNFVERS